MLCSSGKCQIMHWRQGHKDECRPVSALHVSKDSARVVDISSQDQLKTGGNNEPVICSDPNEQLDDSGSSSSSLPCFSSSTEHSETSFDASSSENFESGTPDRVGSGGFDYHASQSTSDSDEADVPSVPFPNPSVQTLNNMIGITKVKKSQDISPDDDFQASSSGDKRTCTESLLSKNCLGTTELWSSQSSAFLKTSSSVENHTNQALLLSDKLTKSMSSKRSGNVQQVPSVDIRNSPCLRSSSTTSLQDFWGNEAQLSRSKETRSLSFRRSENDQRMSLKTGTARSLLPEIGGAQTSSQPTGKAKKTSVQKFVEHFSVSKHSNSYRIDIGKHSAGNYNHKVLIH